MHHPLYLFSELLLAAGVVILTTHILRFASRSRRLNVLPGPPVPSRLFGHLLDLKAAQVGTRYNVWGKKYGHTYKIYDPLSVPVLVLADPKGINHVLSSGSSNYVRPATDRVALELFFGRGLFCAEGEEHRRMRKTLNGAFTSQSIQEVSHILFDLAYRLQIQWEELIDQSDSPSIVFNVSSSVHILSLDAISMTTFMYNCSASSGTIPDMLQKISDAPRANRMNALLEVLVSVFPLLLKLPSPMKTWTDRLRNELGVIADDVWAGVKKGGNMHAKVLTSLSQSGTSEGMPISREEAVAQIIGILFAGSESSANVITECFYEFSRKRHIQDKLRAELVTFERTQGHAPTYEDLTSSNALPYLDAVIRETCRTKAVLMDISRAAVEEDIIPLQNPIIGTRDVTQVTVQAGQLIQIPVRDGINVDESIWGVDAAEFRPERWLDDVGLPESVRNIRAQGHMLTFGDGPKVCIGRLFAIAELKIVISIMVRHFVFEDDGSTLDFYHLGGNTVKPKVRGKENDGVQMPLRVRRVQAVNVL